MSLFSNDRELRDYIAQEIRLAMQQERTISSGIHRAAIADVRAARILAKLDNVPQCKLTEVPTDLVERVAAEFVRTAPPVD